MAAAIDRVLGFLPANLDYVILLFLRVSALIFSSPLFGRQSIPAIAKICLCMGMSAVFLFSTPMPPDAVAVSGLPGYLLLCLLEMLFGITLGYMTTMFFAIAFTAGMLIDNQIGFGMVNVYDPQSGSQIPVTGNLLNLTMLIVFFATGAHRGLFIILADTIENLPVGQITLSMQMAEVAVTAFTRSFLLAMQVAMPFVASGLLAEAAMGIIIRSVPQMNMFVVGIPLKILIGFAMLFIVIGIFVNFTPYLFEEMYAATKAMFGAMAP